MNPLSLIPVRFYVYFGVALLIGYLVYREHSLTRRLNVAVAAERQANANLLAEREARATEQTDRRNADAIAQSAEAELARIRAEPRITGVRLCPRLPTASSESGSPGVVESPAAGRVEGAVTQDPGRDVSDELDSYANDCALVGVIAGKWQEWDAGRTH